MREFTTLLEELHDLRGKAQKLQLSETEERLRIAIVTAALELEVPTGLKVKDLIHGTDFHPTPNHKKS